MVNIKPKEVIIFSQISKSNLNSLKGLKLLHDFWNISYTTLFEPNILIILMKFPVYFISLRRIETP
jgi:hypothetical protein